MIIKGFVEVRLINKDTLAVEQVISQENTITQQMRLRLTYYAISTLTSNTVIGRQIVISADTNQSVSDFPWIREPIFGFTPVGVTSPQVFDKTESTPLYSQWTQRFDPPAAGQTRTINTIGLTPSTVVDTGTDKVTASAYVKLTSACTQTDTQLLDVIYRIQWIRDSAQMLGFINSDDTFYRFVERIVMGGGSSDYVIPTDILLYPLHTSHTPDAGTAGRVAGGSDPIVSTTRLTGTGTSVTTPTATYFTGITHPLYKRVLTGTTTTSSIIGKIIGCEAYYNSTMYRTHGWRNVIAPTNSNVQPIHSHAASTFSSSSATPFLDAQPSSGTGKLAGGGTWTNPDYPEEYMIKITSGGNVGTATYQFWKRNHFGFDGASYVNRHEQVPLMGSTYGSTITDYSTITQPLVGCHGVLVHPQNELITSTSIGSRAVTYDYTRIVTSDASGITRLDITDQSYINRDSTTTPPLPVTNIRQISVNKSNGEVWVACEDTGLWKISADFNTITHITSAGNGVPSDQAYGVDVGRLNSIWAIFNGGLSASNDNGVTWTNYNPSTVPAFAFTGITDNNWNSVSYLKADPEHIDDQLLIVRKVTTTVLQTTAAVWWSRGVGTTSSVSTSTSFEKARQSPHLLDVSDNESFWVLSGTGSSTTAVLFKLTFGSGTITGIGATGTAYLPSVAFEKGPSGQQCVFSVSSANPYTVTLYDKNLNTVASSTVPACTYGEYMSGSSTSRVLYMGKGVYTAVKPYSAFYLTHLVVGVVPDTANSLVGPFSYLIWDKYGWNGTSWELNHSGSKTTHAVSEELLNGTTLTFQNGAGTSFITNDYYTFGVTPGIFKDNSVAYNTYTSFYFTTTKTSTTFGGNVRPYPSTGTVTWKLKSTQLVVNPNNSLTNLSPSRQYGLAAISNNRVFGDFVITGTVSPGGATRYISIGLSPNRGLVMSDSTNWHNVDGIENIYELRMQPSNVFVPYVNGSSSGTSTTITVNNTPWEIRRVGGTITFYVGGVLKHTVTGSTEPSFVIRVLYGQLSSILNSQTLETVEPITVVSSGTGYYTEAGSLISGEGIYDPDFLSVDCHSSTLPTLQISLDGVPVVTKLANSTSTSPGPGEVMIYGEHGDFIFNAADNGKVVTGSYLYTKK